MVGLKFIPAELVERLAGYHIGTVVALLGATRSLLGPISVGQACEALAVKPAENLAGGFRRKC